MDGLADLRLSLCVVGDDSCEDDEEEVLREASEGDSLL